MAFREVRAFCLECDRCGQVRQGADSLWWTDRAPEFARILARRAGWSHSFGRDLCRECTDRQRALDSGRSPG